MKTSRSLLAAVAVATALAVFAGPPADAATQAERGATTELGRLQTEIGQVRDSLVLDAQQLVQARAEDADATDSANRWTAQLRADLVVRTGLLAQLDQGVAQLYMLRASSDNPLSIVARFTALKSRIDFESLHVEAARARLAAATASLNRAYRIYQVAGGRFARLQATAARLGVIVAAPPPRVQVRVSRGARGYICPVAGPVHFTDDFGEPRPTGRHTGVDMHADIGTPVVAVFAGKIVDPPPGYENSGYGNLQVLLDNAGNEWWYAHLSAKLASPGETVQPGQVIGRVGCSGRCSGPHLHFEFRPRAQSPADPYPFLVDAC